MSKVPRWKAEKAKIKVVFRLQFHATHVPQSGWDKLFVSFVPLETGKVAAKTNKSNVKNGSCKWADPIYESTRLILDTRAKKYDEKLYKLVVSMGTSRSSVLGEVNINLADFSDAQKPSTKTLPLEGCEHGTHLHVTVQLLTSKTGFREFEQQREIGEKRQLSSHETAEKIQISPRAASFQKFIGHQAKFKPGTTIHSLRGVSETNEDLEEATTRFNCLSYTSEYLTTENNDIFCTPDANKNAHNDSDQTLSEKDVHSDKCHLSERNNVGCSQNSDYETENELTNVYKDGAMNQESIKASPISEIWMEVSSLQKIADELAVEMKTALHHISSEIVSGELLVREVSSLKSECLKFKAEIEELKHAKGMLNEMFLPMNDENIDSLPSQLITNLHVQMPLITSKYENSVASFAESPSVRSEMDKDNKLHSLRVKFLHDLSFVENKVKEIQHKVEFLYNGTAVDILPDFTDLDTLLLNLKKGIINSEYADIQEATVFNDAYASSSERMQSSSDDCLKEKLNSITEEKICHLLNDLDASKTEQENLMRKMRQMECYYENLIHKLEVSHNSSLSELDTLKSEHLICHYTISSLQTQMEKMHLDMEMLSRSAEERKNLEFLNKELEKRVFASETMMKKIRWNYSIAVERLQKDLELLSDQVLSLFETNVNLARQALVEASQVFFVNSPENNSGNGSPSKRPEKDSIFSVADSDMSVFTESIDSGKLSRLPSCLKALDMERSFLHGPDKVIDLGKGNDEAKTCIVQSNSMFHDSGPLSLIFDTHANVHTLLVNEGLSIEDVRRTFNVLQEHCLKTEAELCDVHVDNICLDIFSSILKEIMMEKISLSGHLENELHELEKKLRDSINYNELLQMEVQTLADVVRKLRDIEVEHISECDDLSMKNHILEAELRNISDEKSFLIKRVSECELIAKDLCDIDMKYKSCNAERLSFEELLKQETANKAVLEKKLTVTLEATKAMETETCKYRSLVEDLQKVVGFARDKLTNLCLNFSNENILVSESTISSETLEEGLEANILYLDQLHKGINKIFFDLRKERKVAEEKKSAADNLLKIKETDLEELTAKYNLSNDIIESLQSELELLSQSLSSCLEAEKLHSEKNRELSTKFAGIELELQLAIAEKNHLVEQLCELDSIRQDLEKTKQCFASCMHEKETLMLSNKSGNERNIQLEKEICILRERLTSANSEILSGIYSIEKIADNISYLTVSIVEMQIHIDEQGSQITNLESQMLDAESHKSILQNLVFQTLECKAELESEKTALCDQVSDLEIELFKCKKSLKSLNFDLQAERVSKEKLESDVTALTSQLKEKCQMVIDLEEHKAKLTHLQQQLSDMESVEGNLKMLLTRSDEERKSLDDIIISLRSEVCALENQLDNLNGNFVATHENLFSEKEMGEKLNTIVMSLQSELLQMSDQIQRNEVSEQKLNDALKDLTCVLNEKDKQIDKHKLEIFNLQQQISDLESNKSELHHLFVKCQEAQKKIEEENSALLTQISDLHALHHDLNQSWLSTKCDLQCERDCCANLQQEVSELNLVIEEKSRQLMHLESLKNGMSILNQQMLDLELENGKMQDVVSKNRDFAKNLFDEIAALHSLIIDLERGLADANKSLGVTCKELHVEKELRLNLEGIMMDLQRELAERDMQILSFKENQSKLILDRSFLLVQKVDIETQYKEMLECVILEDLKVTYIKSQFSEVFETVLNQLHSLNDCYTELELQCLDAKSLAQQSSNSKSTEENEKFASALSYLNYKHSIDQSKKPKHGYINDTQVEAISSIIEDGFANTFLFVEEIKHLRRLLKDFEEETDMVRAARDEMDITLSVLKSKLDEQVSYLLMLKEYDVELIKMREQHNDLHYRLSEQILKTEEFKSLSVHLKELKDKADMEYMNSQEKKETERSSVAVQESLRVAFIKEQCETTVQELKNQLAASKKYGEELLMKLQNAVDEVEFRKKREVFHLKRNEDMLLELTELKREKEKVSSEKEALQNSCDDLKTELDLYSNRFNCCRDEKLKLEASLRECHEDRTRSRVELDLVRRRLEILSSSVDIFESNPEIRSPDCTSFRQLLEGNRIGFSVLESTSASNLYFGKETHAADSRIPEEKVNLMETCYKLNGHEDTLLQTGHGSTQDFLLKNECLKDQANLLQYYVDFKEHNEERENLNHSLEMLHKELEMLKKENLASHIPFDECHINYDRGLQHELSQLDKANEHLGNLFPSFKNFSVSGNAFGRVITLELELANALKEKGIHLQSSFLKHVPEEAIFQSLKDINELLKEMLLLKGRSTTVESELKEMHRRYSQLSLQFAEVEGERQKLMLMLKNRTPRQT